MSAGLEQRTTILPQPAVPANVPGVFGPDYSFADSVPLPGDVGVHDGDTIDSVIGAVKGAAFYIDTIGFGASSSGLTSGMPLKPLGVNTYVRTGQKCANGADMWAYMQGIPTGNSMSKRLAQGLASVGMPPLKGLAPGILEDVEDALDPTPVMSAIFGTGYVSCKQEANRVGDQDGNIQNPATCSYYVENPETVVSVGGVPTQTRWVKDRDLTQEQYAAASASPKFCPDGYNLSDHTDSDCLKPLANPPTSGPYVNSACTPASGFINYSRAPSDSDSAYLIKTMSGIGAAAMVLLAIGVIHKSLY